jgi:uncharacterized damage-inducible protein DinB
MLKDVLTQLYERDLKKLRTEIELYPSDADMWRLAGDIPNSGGNLCMHLCGNLRHFIGFVLGNSGYVRDRDLEFTDTNVSRDELLARVDATLDEVKAALEKLSDEDLEKEYPIDVFDSPMTTGYFVTHLATHFNYHLGQLNYHRRLIAAA